MKFIARFLLVLAAAQLAFSQPTVPVSNLYPVTANTLVGGGSTTGRGQPITAGSGISIANGVISSTGGAGDAPAGATYILKTANATLTNAQALSSLSSGVVTVTTGTGVLASVAPGASGNVLTSNGTVWASAVPSYTGNVTAAGTLASGDIVIGQGSKAVATSSVISVSGSNATVTGNLAITGTTTFNNVTTSNLTVTGNIVGNLAASQVTVADAGGYYTGTNAEAVLQEVGASIAALNANVGPSPTGNQLISWGGVAAAPSGGLNITVSPASYSIQNALYSSAQTNLTLSTADPSNPRIDVIAVNTSGNAVVITGTPAANPAKPDVDPSTQLELTFFLVGAGATSLNVTVTNVYLNNAEWTTTASGGTINVASTNNPYTGSVCIEGTSVGTGNYVQFVKPASGTFDLADSDNLVFYIRSKASWANPRLMTISIRNASGQLGSAVTFDQGLFGFDSSQTSTYQQIIIPTGLFAANGLSTATTIRMTLGGTGGTVGFYIDDVTLQSGVASTSDASRMKWRGNYVASNFYNVNDVVLSAGIQYVAIQAGAGNTPASSATFWQPSSSNSGGTVTGSGLTANAIVVGGGGSAVTIGASPGSSGNILTSNGTAWVSSAPATSGNVTVSGTPTSGQLASWTSATNIQGITSANVTQGGTGLATLTANNIVTGNGTGPVTFIAPGTSGNIVTSNGTAFNSTAPAWFGNALVSGCTTVTANSTGNITFASPNANLTITTDNTTKTITFNATGGGGGSGTVNSATSGQVAVYSASTAVSGYTSLLHSDSTGVTSIRKDQNAITKLGIRNDNTGTSAASLITMESGNNGVDPAAVIFTNKNWNALAGFTGKSGMYAISSTLALSGATAIDFYLNLDASKILSIDSNGFAAQLASTQWRKDHNGSTSINIRNDNTGTSAFPFLAVESGTNGVDPSLVLFANKNWNIFSEITGKGGFYVNSAHAVISANGGGKEVQLYAGGISSGNKVAVVNSTSLSAELTTTSSSTTTGALISKGGLGVAGKTFTGNDITTSGDFITDTIGKTLKVKSGSNSKAGTVTLSAGAGTISSTAITANSVLCISLKTASGVITLQPYATAVTAGTSYTIAAGAGDNSTYNWAIIEIQ